MSKKALRLTLEGEIPIIIDVREIAGVYPIEGTGSALVLKGRDRTIKVLENTDYICSWVFEKPMNLEDLHFHEEVEKVLESNRQMARTMDLLSSVEELWKKIQEL